MLTCHSSQIKYTYIIKVHAKNYRLGWDGDQLSVAESWMAFELDLKGKWMWEGHLEIGVYQVFQSEWVWLHSWFWLQWTEILLLMCLSEISKDHSILKGEVSSNDMGVATRQGCLRIFVACLFLLYQSNHSLSVVSSGGSNLSPHSSSTPLLTLRPHSFPSELF